MNKSNRKHKGFTLIEMIVAIVILLIMATVSYAALSNFTNDIKIYTKHSKNLSNLQQFSLLIDRDFMQIVGQKLTLKDNVITFNSEQNDELLEIIYSFDDNEVKRTVNGIYYKNNETNTIFDDISSVKIRLWGSNNKWQDSWDYEDNKFYPKVLEVVLKHSIFNDITKLVFIDE